MDIVSNLLSAGPLAYIGLAFLPTPPSPVPDFGTQFLFSLVVGLLAPERVVTPFSKLVKGLGLYSKQFFLHIPLLCGVAEKLDDLWGRWLDWISKERESDREIVNKIYSKLEDELIIDRIIFGYICSIAVGLILIGLSIILVY